ncbi:MAG: acetyl-CoA carboxylase biotin carboxylase subunit [Myxococcales bacterium]|nr:acetyl-CoA carboxylase biotin carboxylase subunit [Myxococcales bacterium]
MFRKILVANRGEIAVRVMRTCKVMGISTVAVYSEADKDALHVLEADEAVCIGEAEPHASYLRIDRILEAAKQTGAEAIHPGYGFLSERAPFAKACEEAGVVFIGPPAGVIDQLGDKLVARELMQSRGVPVTPGVLLEGADLVEAKKAVDAVGYPVLIKAAAGGGGKGMRIVERAEDFDAACKQAASEAQAAFGDSRVYVEKYISQPRHIEFQVIADKHGHALHLLERECSVQRRYQKIIEETPSPILDDALRARMGEAAVEVVRASGYVNAGTVEFLLDGKTRDFYFLEVNTRLQVEHPVTEAVTGLDLVRLQIEIAAGQPLTLKQEDVRAQGHAFECRIYAEDPAHGFAPSPGKIRQLHLPQGPGIRHDVGVYAEAEVPVYYDPILAKLIVHGPTREAARQRMVDALRQYAVLGIRTPVAYLIDVMEHEAFAKGDLTTHFLKDYFTGWSAREDQVDLACIAYVLDEMFPAAVGAVASGAAGEGEPPSPWQTLGAWRMSE